MRSFKIFITLAILGFTAMAIQAFVAIRSEANISENAGNGFAVVELFTSEGCSSCPPADALVARVQKQSAGKPIYILAYHVDYWDRLGWKDAFSSPAYSDRQKQYARWLKLSSIYTPQIVVNGRTEFVGSEENKLNNTIKAGLQKPAKATFAISDIKVNGNKANLKYHAENAPANASLLIALVEKAAVTKVQRGENGGRTLSHVQIVRQLKNVPLKNETGTEDIMLPQDFKAHEWELIAFTQNNTNGEITGAVKAEFPSSAGVNAAK